MGILTAGGTMMRVVVCGGLLLVTCASCVSPPVVEQQKFDALHHSGLAVESALGVGTTYPRFMELVQNFATEVKAGDSKIANDRERLMMDKYNGALALYIQ